jgi:nucleoside-diphosphate kinase
MNRSKLLYIIATLALVTAGAFFGYRLFSGKKLRTNAIERTLAIIKPDAIRARNTGKIIDRIEQEGYTIIDLKKITLDREPAERLYQNERKESFFNGLIDFMTSGPVVVMILEKMNAVADWRDLIGDTNPKKAKQHTLRHQFGTDVRHNGIHGSSAHDEATREIKLFFADRMKA